MLFRLATMADAGALWRWRNDTETRRWSRLSEPVSWELHVSWLESSLARPDRTLLIAVSDNAPVGTGRLDFEPTGTELSWTIAPERRGRGLGTALVRYLAAVAGPSAFAAIHAEHAASRHIAEAAGFVVIRTEGVWEHWIRPSDPARLGRWSQAEFVPEPR